MRIALQVFRILFELASVPQQHGVIREKETGKACAVRAPASGWLYNEMRILDHKCHHSSMDS